VEVPAFVAGPMRVTQTAGARGAYCPSTVDASAWGSTHPPLRSHKAWPGAKHGRRVSLQAGNPDQEEVQPVEAELVEAFDPLGLGGGSAAAAGMDMDQFMLQRTLWESARTGDVEGISSAVSKGADANFAYSEEGGARALQCAALNGNLAAVQKLASLGADVNGQDDFKWTALHDAALNGHTEVCEVLAKLGANVNGKTDVEDETPGAGERTPLNNAAMNGHTATVIKLVDLGADIQARQKDGWTALHLAAKNGWEETVAKLVALGLDVNAKNDADMTPLHYAAWDATVETCQTLIALGVDVGHKAKGKLSAPDLARKRVSGPGVMLVELLDYASGVAERAAAPPIGDDATWEEWAPTDEDWQTLIKNDPFKTSVSGGNL